MKKSTLILILIIVSFSSFRNENLKGYIVLSGEIENPNSDSISVFGANQHLLKVIYLTKDNTFRDTLHLPEGYYRLNDGTEGTQIYLKPKFDLKISLNTKEFDESIIYEGAGSNENNYMAKKALLRESFGKLNSWGFYARLDETVFLKLTDSLYDVTVNFLNNYPNLDKGFVEIETKSLEFQEMVKYYNYESMRRFVTGDKNFTVSENFPNPFENVNLTDEKLLVSSSYLSYIESYLSFQTGKSINKDDSTADFTLEYMKIIYKEVKNDKIKEQLAYGAGKWRLNRVTKLDSVYDKIAHLLTNEKYLIEVKEIYDRIKKIEKGTVSPTFELEDINGKIVSLNQLKGKLVYVDIWATWCLPCIKEIPHLKKLEEHFTGKDIHFVSISKNDNKESWTKMVEEKELGGIQIFAPDENIPFFKDYTVQGIPRFILLDKEGKIIDANAKRPSNPKLIEEINGLL